MFLLLTNVHQRLLTVIRRVCGVPGARLIKEADISDNHGRLDLVEG
jgi:hypothetical protein